MTELLDRREMLRGLSVSAAAVLLSSKAFAFPNVKDGEELVPFLDTPRPGPNRLDWETLTEWLTPQDQVFNVQHYNTPTIKPEEYRLEIAGLVEKPQTLTLDDIKKLPRKDQLMTLECSGNGASKGFSNAVYNSKWTGTPLKPLLEAAGIKPGAVEVAFIGYDHQVEELRKGTPREVKFDVPFGRGLSLHDALHLDALLAYERNGQPLEGRNGAPLRLIVPGWYGVANVKWLKRIEVRDRRYMGRYMARDYVTIRGERRGDQIEFVETSVGRLNLKSVVARVMKQTKGDAADSYTAYGAVWGDGTPIKAVEVSVDGGEWKPAAIDAEPFDKFSWRFFSCALGKLGAGKHKVVSRAISENGKIQPTAEDDEIALKKTYWEAYQQWPREIEIAGA